MQLPSSCSSKTIRSAMPPLGAVLVMLLSTAALATSCTEQERSSLLQFIAELSHDMEECYGLLQMGGITCSSNTRAVTDVTLPSRNLQGRISASIADLTGLLHLNLSYNSLSGSFPLELVFSKSTAGTEHLNGDLRELQSSTLRPLQVLNISSNKFTGRFPSTTWEMTRSLVVLNASNNSFTGRIPATFCFSAPSFAVELSHSQFSGSIPPQFGNCSMLTSLGAGNNLLSGTLPDELFSATTLEYLSLRNNGLQGTLDGASIAKLHNLVTLDLGGNKLSGKIPDSIGQHKRLMKQLYLDCNGMYGELPASLGNCTNLMTINLKGNRFSGDLGKVNFYTLLNLQTMDLYMNSFTGTIPETIYSCSNLTALRLSSNRFHGNLSSRICDLSYLSFLSLGNNSFTDITSALQILKGCRNLSSLFMGHNFKGELMPQDETIDGFKSLKVLDLERCSLSGEIPLWLSRLVNLEMLVLSENRLTGLLPNWINSLSHLFYLDMSSNNLTGEIPIALTKMPMVRSPHNAACFDLGCIGISVYRDPSHQYGTLAAFPVALKLGSNNFTGTIPLEIGELKALADLNLSSNKLYGEIPQSLCNLTNLQLLDLHNNHLTGAIPASLNNLHFLSAFNVSANDLEGPVPTGGQFDTFDTSSYYGNPKLCGPMLSHTCDSAAEVPAPRLYSNRCSYMIASAIGFSVFFGVGVLLDQTVLSRLTVT